MGSGLSCTREVPVSVPKVKTQMRPAASSLPGNTAAGGMGAAQGSRPGSAPATTVRTRSSTSEAPPPAASIGAPSPAPFSRKPSATSPASAPAAGLAGRLPHIGGLAVSLAFLLDFAERNVGRSQPTWAVVEQLVKPHTLQDTVRYVDLPHVACHVLPPGRSDYYFISHAWGRPFWEMAGLCAHYLRGAVPEDTYVWCDIFIINQHPGQQQQDDLHQLRLAVRDAAATLVCTDAAGAPFERIWCLFEMWTTLTVSAGNQAGSGTGGDGGSEGNTSARSSNGTGPRGNTCETSTSKAGRSGTPALETGGSGGSAGSGDAGGDGGGGGGSFGAPTLSSSGSRSRSQALVVLTTGLSAAQRAKLYSQIDAAAAKATVASDKDRILADIDASPGGVPAFNAAMRSALLLRPLDYESEVARCTAVTTAAEWDFSLVDSWLALPPDHPNHRALALLGAPGTGKSTAAAAVLAHIGTPVHGSSAGGGGGRGAAFSSSKSPGVPWAAHFCRSNDLQALDPLAALRTLAYQLSLIFPEQLQHYYAFELAKDGSDGDGRGGGGSDDGGSGVSFTLQVIAGMAAAGGQPDESTAAAGGGGGGGQDPVAAAFEALLLRPLNLVWKSYEDAVQLGYTAAADVNAATAASTSAAGSQGRQQAEAQGGGGSGSGGAGEGRTTTTVRRPCIVLLVDAVDEGDSGSGGGHENAMLLMLQEHFPRLPPFVRLVLTARPQADIRALMTHKFDPWVISPAQLRAPQQACAGALATRLAARPALAAALRAVEPKDAGELGGGDGGATVVADRLWRASNGWVLFLRLAEDILEATAVAAAHGSSTASSPGKATSAALPLPPPLASVLTELEAAAATQSSAILYPLYLRTVVAPRAAALGAAVARDASIRSGAALPSGPADGAAVGGSDARPAADRLAFLLEVLGAAREPLYLSQLQDLGLPAIGDERASLSTQPPPLRPGSLVSVHGYKLHGIHRSLFEWLASGGANSLHELLNSTTTTTATTATTAATVAVGGRTVGGGGASGLRRGHAALAAMAVRDVAAARASQAGGGGARGPCSPDPYSLQHGVAHVLQAAADLSAAGEERAACSLLSSLLLDFYFWRCVYQDGAAAGVALSSLLRHEATFSAALATVSPPSAVATATAGGGSGGGDKRPGRPAGGHGGQGAVGACTAAALTADVARWLQSYHGVLLRRPEAILQAALALPAASPVRAAALAALANPQLPPPPTSSSPNLSKTSSRSGSATATATAASSGASAALAAPRPVSSASSPGSAAQPVSAAAAAAALWSSSGAELHSDAAPPPCAPPSAAPQAAVPAQLSGTTWPPPFALSNPAAEWDGCLLTVDGRGTTRGLAWEPEQGLLVAACDDKKVNLISPVTGSTVGIMKGHSDRVYCVALRPVTQPAVSPSPGASAGSSDPSHRGPPLVASGSLDGRVALWDGTTGVQLQLLEPGEPKGPGCGEASEEEPHTVSVGFSVVEDRPTGRSAAGSVDCLAFSPDGHWLAAGTNEGCITVWRMVEATDHSTSNGSGHGNGSEYVDGRTDCGGVRAIKAWACTTAHTKPVAGLVFIELPVAGGTGSEAAAQKGPPAGPDGGGGDGGGLVYGRNGLPPLVLASCSEDESLHLWDPWVGTTCGSGSGGGGRGGPPKEHPSAAAAAVTIVTAPLLTLRSDSEAQAHYEATGRLPQPLLQPSPYSSGANGSDPWYVSDQLAAVGIGAAGFLIGPQPSASPSQPSSASPPLLSGVAEDVQARQSRATYRAPQHLCLAAGPGLPQGCLLAGTGSGPVAVWDVATGLLRERLRGHVGAVHCIALQDGGPHFASGSGDCTVRLWRHTPSVDPRSWETALQAARKQAQQDLAAAAAAAAAAEQSQGRGEEAGQQRQAEPPSRACHRPCQWQCVSVLRGHNRLVTSAVFLSVPTSSPARGAATAAATAAIAASGTGSTRIWARLATASVDFTVRVWKVRAWTPAAGGGGGDNDGGSGGGDSSPAQEPPGHAGFQVNAVAVSGDGQLIATGADDFTACVWDGASGAARQTLRSHHGRVNAVAFSRDNKRLATAADDGDIRIFSCEEGFSITGWCRGHKKAATGVAFSPDGFSIVSSSEDGTARVWSVRGFQMSVLEGHPSGATAVAWAEEGSLVATGAARGEPGVQLWDARTGMHMNTYRYHVSDVVRLAFGSATEAPQPPPAPPRSRPASAASPTGSGSGKAGADGASAPPPVPPPESPPPPRRHTLLLSVDLRGLACVWDVWGGGLLHCVNHVQGADLAGSKMLWLQARAMHYADLQEIFLPPPASETNGAASDVGGSSRPRRRRPAVALAGLYPAGESVDVVAVGPQLSCITVVTDKQRLYIFRPQAPGLGGAARGGEAGTGA